MIVGLWVLFLLVGRVGGGEVPEGVREAMDKLELPGITIQVEERSVDVEAVVCLTEGLLELVACTEDSKEHESIVAVRALPSHIHTALLLLGGKPGQPAMRRPVDGVEGRLVDVPPRGGLVEVSLLIEDEAGEVKERPISEFIERSGSGGVGGGGGPQEGEAFPTDRFLFAGSILAEGRDGVTRYLSDLSGHVISLATFGDELLCQPGLHDPSTGALEWQIKGAGLPDEGSGVVLRLRVVEGG
jgi:hypothetical protein